MIWHAESEFIVEDSSVWNFDRLVPTSGHCGSYAKNIPQGLKPDFAIVPWRHG
jgi:hypothetical protein